ncbi:bifunctional (p)ppGpp synthetase/guanosine-3',5'-bis(diphosphate) 3'-pyrophosphohydrolase [Thiohalocapsa marina]|uniref:guanosine-3',5'-bis(diphosphate) 3'-diphosphatase n=1 Tax=Thiohalocapsa marina TaxID=424902 RepID=A0A5M8FQL4_9GAMM|nr:bifunctional (p)ppGpp synthetase/guanosine-3',5'-bis(diphosphate) 3'-pyrophosphohydrolase [Thiohalocapsa marina]KAA6184815.1 bifunctional (p)ppGpp synthetase/guanosine-3',5'-bis(diphosphate) 3'-pyrophosphohydrolase [Thiohalocapsa marina]
MPATATAGGAIAVPVVDAAAPAAGRPRFLISDLCAYLESYLPPEQVSEVYRAYLFSAEAHHGQQRRTGEPYIYHPIAVARILAEMRMDHKCIMAAILHDVLEDTGLPKDDLARQFDDEIAELVDGVSKLTQIDFKSRAEAQAASFRKMMLAMTRDIRVILIKLADRLHNMRTLGVMAPEKRRRISRETLEIYAPIANRLGINSIRLELEDQGFRHHWPWRYHVLEAAVRRERQHQRELVANVETAIRRRLQQEDIQGEVFGREKHLYSIYLKMQGKAKAFNEVVDVFAFRVVVDRVDTCYRVLGQVHSLYKPVPGRFKDYIAIPKSNGYQSLHTVLFGPQGTPIEIQIRTQEMNRIAEAGIAAHWLYKGGDGAGAKPLADDWLQNLLEMQRDSGDSQEFLEHVKVDLFPDEVYVFTPKGRIMVLPRGATVVDFAYAIHSDVGNTCVAARIDRRLAPLRTGLYSGQTVEIINAPGAKPNAAWLNFVVTGKARANIRGYLKNLQHQEAEALGRRMLTAELAGLGLDLEQIGGTAIAGYAHQVGLDNVGQLLAEIGLGNRLPLLVARALAGTEARESMVAPDADTGADRGADRDVGRGGPRRLAIRGTEGMVVHFARCCRPIPGDDITGLFSPGKGIVVHRCGCRNLGDFQDKRDKWLEVEWAQETKAEFATEIRVEVGNRRGALATIAAAIAEQGSNIENVQSREKDGMTSTLDFTINVTSRDHLALIMRRLRRIPLVVRIVRLSR